MSAVVDGPARPAVVDGPARPAVVCGPADGGTTVVEFAIVSALLFMILFGIIQYGIGFFERQAASSTVREAARLAAVGVDNCETFRTVVMERADGNGLGGKVAQVTVDFRPPHGTDDGVDAVVGDPLRVTISYTPVRLGLPFVPYPTGPLTATATARIEQLGGETTSC